MAQCPKCHHDVIAVTYGQQTVLLDPHYRCYAAVDEHDIYPEDGARVFLTTALVEHHAVCSAERREQADARAAGKRTYQRQKGARA